VGGLGPAQVHLSVSTWRQPLPPAASPQRAALLEHVAERSLAVGDSRLRVGIDGLLEPAGVAGSGNCVLCSIDPLTQIDHSAVITKATSDAVLVVDGVFAFRPEINDYWDFRIWRDIDPQMSLRRGTQQDEAWAGSEAEAVHEERYLVAERPYIEEADPIRLVDIVIDNSNFDRPRVVRPG
jgi:uridine kinase